MLLGQFSVASGASEPILIGLFRSSPCLPGRSDTSVFGRAATATPPNWEGLFEPFRRLAIGGRTAADRSPPLRRRSMVRVAAHRQLVALHDRPDLAGCTPIPCLWRERPHSHRETVLSALATPVFRRRPGRTTAMAKPRVKDEFADCAVHVDAYLADVQRRIMATKLRAAALKAHAGRPGDSWSWAVPLAVMFDRQPGRSDRDGRPAARHGTD